MTGPGLADPALTAFWASDPGVLTTPDPLAPEAAAVHSSHHERLALELAAAFLICAKLVRNQLGEHAGEHDPRKIAGQAWAKAMPVWMNFAGVALRESMKHGPFSAPADVASSAAIATEYAAGLGDYLGLTSTEAFVGAVDQQLAGRWSERVAWLRGAAGFGLDKSAYGPYLKLASQEGLEVISPAAQTLADAALVNRAQLIGDSEAYTSGESAKALIWLQMQRGGQLPETARRRWDNIEAEGDCAECRHLHEQEVELDQPFITTGGLELWAPQAHPNCRCSVQLVAPVMKAYDPKELRDPKGSPTGGRFTRKPATVTTAEPVDPAIAEMLAQAREQSAEPSEIPFDTTDTLWDTADPFAADPGAAFDQIYTLFDEADPFADTDPFAGTTPSGSTSAFDDTRGLFERGARGKVNVIRAAVEPIPMEPADERGYPYYMPVDDYHAQTDEAQMHGLFGQNFDVDFDKAAPMSLGEQTLAARAVPSPWNALEYDYLSRGRVGKKDNGLPRADKELVRTVWSELAPYAKQGWWKAINEAQDPYNPRNGIVARLDWKDTWDIAELAGFTNFDPTDPEDLKSKVIAATHKLGTGDNSLASAYADWVVYQRPDLLGELGDEIATQIAVADMAGIKIASSRPADQVMVFDTGFHPGTEVYDEEAEPVGKYRVVGITYRSAIYDLGSPPPLAIGLQEAHMQPYYPPGTHPSLPSGDAQD